MLYNVQFDKIQLKYVMQYSMYVRMLVMQEVIKYLTKVINTDSQLILKMYMLSQSD